MEITRGKIPTAKKVVIYGPEGIGKSTLAACFPNAVFIDTEGGTKELTIGRLPEPKRWEDIINTVKWTAANPGELDTLVIDTMDQAEPMAAAYVCKQNGIQNIEAAGYGKGYTYLADEIRRFLRFLDSVIESGTNVVLVCHAQMRKFEQPDEMGAYDRWELKLQKKVAPLVKEWADMVLFCNYKTMVVTDEKTRSKKAKGGKRVMYTQHHPCWDAKNRFDLEEELPMEFKQIAFIFDSVPKKAVVSPAETPKNPAKEWAETPKKASKPKSKEKEPEYTVPTRVTDLLKRDGIAEKDLRAVLCRKGYLGHTDDELTHELVEWITDPDTWKLVCKEIGEDEVPF